MHSKGSANGEVGGWKSRRRKEMRRGKRRKARNERTWGVRGLGGQTTLSHALRVQLHLGGRLADSFSPALVGFDLKLVHMAAFPLWT